MKKKQETIMKKKLQYTVQLEEEFANKLQDMADKLGLTRSQLMRNLLMTAYEDAEILYKIGLIPAVQFAQKLKDYKDKLINEMFNKSESKA